MKLPLDYEKMIVNLYEKEGQNWLNNLDGIIEKNAKIYDLHNFKLIDNLTYNVVMTAVSKKYGNVIVKIGLPNEESIYEINALKAFNGNFACKCYEYNFTDNFYILERLNPGTNLLEVKSQKKRIEIFCNLAQNLPVKATDVIDLPTHRETLNSSFNKAKGEKKGDYKKIIDLMKIADIEYRNIEKLKLDKYVLHGDLHHGNIILNGNQYKAIDPHGVIGEKILEIGCFILNELWLFDSGQGAPQPHEYMKLNFVISEKSSDFSYIIKNVIKQVSNYMNISESEIARAAFIRIVLSTAWSVEEKDWRIVEINNKICREILKLI